jgi:hypothetical protein
MPGLLEDLHVKLATIELQLAEVADALRERAAVPDGSIWADGAVSLSQAQAFAHVGRDELWRLMNAGDLPWCVLTRARVVPRRWLVQYLERKQLEAAHQLAEA